MTISWQDHLRSAKLWLNRFAHSAHGVVALRLLAVLGLYTASRALFYVFNRDLLADLPEGGLARAFAGGVRFDLSAIMWTNLLYIAVQLVPLKRLHHQGAQRILAGIFVATNGVALGANCLDLAYYRYTLRRTTTAVFAEFKHEGAFTTLLPQMAWDHWPALLVWAFTIAALLGVVWLVHLSREPWPASSRRYYLTGAAAFPLAAALVVAGARGGLFNVSHRPITLSNAAAYVDAPQHTALVLNTPFSLIRTADKEPLEPRHDFASNEELAQVYTPEHTLAGPARPRNVVIIILESFGPNAIGFVHQGGADGSLASYTPFLDELASQCRAYRWAFANGLHSIDALPPIVASIPNLKQQYVLSHYSANHLAGLATLLARAGYETAFFHGAPNGSMGFDAFAHTAGFAHYYGLDEYPNHDDYDGAWGVWDEEFLQWTAAKLALTRTPFLATVFTVTSHSPFHLPARYQGKFKGGASLAHEVMGYTDYALRRFFATAREMPWYRDTLFVITADHSAARTEREFATRLGRFRVPLLLCDADNPALAGFDDLPAQHADIMPTVLSYVGYRGSFVAFGRDLLAPGPRHAVNYHPAGFYQLVADDVMLQHDGQAPRALYRYREDGLLRKNLLRAEPERVEGLTRLLTAIIQQYNNRMREDRLTLAEPTLAGQ